MVQLSILAWLDPYKVMVQTNRLILIIIYQSMLMSNVAIDTTFICLMLQLLNCD